MSAAPAGASLSIWGADSHVRTPGSALGWLGANPLASLRSPQMSPPSGGGVV